MEFYFLEKHVRNLMGINIIGYGISGATIKNKTWLEQCPM